MPELDGQIALVTGGGRGIGANIARELRSAGAGVAIAARTSDELEEVALEIDAYPVVTDVSKRESVETMVRAVESGRGPIDILCANAGVSSSDERAWEADPADWWRTFEVNVLGVQVKQGTTLLFDLGVYLAVLGTVLTFLFGLSREAER